jgi:DNA-binding SARP family transcriptional activator
MNPLSSFSHAQNQLNGLTPSLKLAILHPDFHGQHRLLAPILEEPNTTILFISLSTAGASLSDLLAQFQEVADTQLGIQIKTLPAKAAEAAAALAKALNGQKNLRLILDAYDLADQSAVAPFIVALVNALPDGARLILGGRELPMALLRDKSLEGKMALIPTEPEKMMLDYVLAGDKTILEVRTLGPGRVLINGQLIDHWDGVLPRTLFFYFVDRGMTTRDEIFQTFWPNLSTREATNVFHVTKRKISEILGTDLTVYWSGFYRLSSDLELHYDVVKFVEAVQNAAIAPDDEAIRLLQNAIEMYHGPFLSTMDQDWVLNRREELIMTYAEALAGLARIYKNRDDKPQALGYFLRAAATNPQREDLARAIMELYRDLNNPQAALETYDRLVEELRADLDVSPSPQTTELANVIQAQL